MDYFRRVVQFVRRFLMGSRQQRHQARYQLQMQLRGIDLRWTSVDSLGLDKTRAGPHGNSGGPGLELVLEALRISPEDSVLDVGSGKGGAMITLARWPFRRVDGVEISPAMIKIAERNLKKLNCVRGTITQADAGDFKDLDDYTYLYLYHPFPEVVMRGLLENVQASLERWPRRLRLIYMNPALDDLIVEAGFRRTRHFDHTLPPFQVYEYAAGGRAPAHASTAHA